MLKNACPLTLRSLALFLRRICASWPTQVPLRVFWNSVRVMKGQALRIANVHALWFSSLLQSVKVKKRTLADSWRYINVAKAFSVARASSPLHKLKPSAADCRSMRRFKLHWRVAVWKSPDELVAEVVNTVKWLAKKMSCSLPRDFCMRVLSNACQLHFLERSAGAGR